MIQREDSRKKKQNIKKEKIETEPKKNVEKKYQDDNVEDIKSGHTNKNIYVYSECESSLHEMSVLWTICSPQSIHMYVSISDFQPQSNNRALSQIRVCDLNRDDIYICMSVY